jgi:CDP-2,3-bis-(O-geranylgeranyl)-sn-glycerol synthase
MMETVITALYFFIPAYVANTTACILGHGRPVDLGRNFFDGRRVFGDGVTIRGMAAGVACGMVSGVLMAFYGIPFGFAISHWMEISLLLSFGALAGDAAGSFIKRRLGLERGAPAPILDQLNFVVGGLGFASLVLPIGVPPLTLQHIGVLFILTPFGHLAVNYTGYQLKMKDVPW